MSHPRWTFYGALLGAVTFVLAVLFLFIQAKLASDKPGWQERLRVVLPVTLMVLALGVVLGAVAGGMLGSQLGAVSGAERGGVIADWIISTFLVSFPLQLSLKPCSAENTKEYMRKRLWCLVAWLPMIVYSLCLRHFLVAQ